MDRWGIFNETLKVIYVLQPCVLDLGCIYTYTYTVCDIIYRMCVLHKYIRVSGQGFVYFFNPVIFAKCICIILFVKLGELVAVCVARWISVV